MGRLFVSAVVAFGAAGSASSAPPPPPAPPPQLSGAPLAEHEAFTVYQSAYRKALLEKVQSFSTPVSQFEPFVATYTSQYPQTVTVYKIATSCLDSGAVCSLTGLKYSTPDTSEVLVNNYDFQKARRAISSSSNADPLAFSRLLAPSDWAEKSVVTEHTKDDSCLQSVLASAVRRRPDFRAGLAPVREAIRCSYCDFASVSVSSSGVDMDSGMSFSVYGALLKRDHSEFLNTTRIELDRCDWKSG